VGPHGCGRSHEKSDPLADLRVYCGPAAAPDWKAQLWASPSADKAAQRRALIAPMWGALRRHFAERKAHFRRHARLQRSPDAAADLR
jgi:hypothetical protein